ncbi:MAG: hypothetical protein GY759_07180 [Chloroflexi bacterium]|nr:hypothetical protein [Chloroflexota bacterium]
MALPDSVKVVRGTAKVFSDSTYSPSDAAQPTGTDAQINLGSIGTSGAARQSAKLDLGSDNLDIDYEVQAYIEWSAAPDAGGTVDMYLGWSDSATAGGNNPGGLSGADSAYTGQSTAADGVKQLDYVGSLVAANAAAIQTASVSITSAKARYVCLVVVNNSSVALATGGVADTAVVITPLEYQTQD